MKNPDGHVVAHKGFRDDPTTDKLSTPSGKIEIFSAQLYQLGKTWELPKGDVITGLPQYAPTWEGVSDRAPRQVPPADDHAPLQATHALNLRRRGVVTGSPPPRIVDQSRGCKGPRDRAGEESPGL